MALPALFQPVIEEWRVHGIELLDADWTTSLRRHGGAKVQYVDKRCFAKLAIAGQRDLDEPDMLASMRREVWWSTIVHALPECGIFLPFTSPRVLLDNVQSGALADDDVAWVLFEYIDGRPIMDSEAERFDELVNSVVASLLALDHIHPQTLEAFGLPRLPSPPHGMRRWEKKGLLDMRTAVLGNGAFEIQNFWRDREGQLVIMDNEFAGWYPKYDHLSYLYHRLYCNTMRPDLAKRMLHRYVQEAMRRGDFNASPDSLRGFWHSFARILKPRLLSGWWNDTRRRKLWPLHKKQRLRYGLFWTMLRGYYGHLEY